MALRLQCGLRYTSASFVLSGRGCRQFGRTEAEVKVMAGGAIQW
jgi:hypothetical protein